MSIELAKYEARTWPVRRQAYLAAGYHRSVAIELAWFDVENRLPADAPLRDPMDPKQPDGSPSGAPQASGSVGTIQPLTQYCQVHETGACIPSRCSEVRLWHLAPRQVTELVCQAPRCGQRFMSNRKDARFHSSACRQFAYRLSRVTDKAQK